jgi:hypothetical protein
MMVNSCPVRSNSNGGVWTRHEAPQSDGGTRTGTRWCDEVWAAGGRAGGSGGGWAVAVGGRRKLRTARAFESNGRGLATGYRACRLGILLTYDGPNLAIVS